ncbi:endothelial monocyte-activating polypeptide II precursor pro-EMAP II family protein [Tieghemostelium lacteum]|uniref:Endothelial monocyte-activating polypeptide II pro-EMAP II family protein n=1 Tax=Tieghemostelium lacteum TaxID=361077 RepID=A0A152A7Q8_TIELA|nr:endothelial monocyte-activating polypeptide II precursor pro-EMAP II family protein [Tieghemostelium lacteum]|eukprot:KYR02165.1 endothelial monocyte-activating polypeptide II precursor pro-EMAP II family protein [Tieghemostelium lacteum]
MDINIFWNLLSKNVEVTGSAPSTDKLSKLIENEHVKKLLPTDTKGIETILKMLDEISDTFTQESQANRKDAQLHKFNKDLLIKTFVFGEQLTSLDLIFYALLHSWMSKLNDKERYVFCNITRWFNFIQNNYSKQVLALVPINQTPPPPEPKKETPKPSATDAGKDAGKKDTTTTTTDKQTQPPKEKQQRKPAATQKEEPKKEDVSRFEIRVGKIVDCKKHENADSLYVENIDLGEEKPRQIVSGLVKFVPLDQMINRRVLVLCNLKASNLKSVRSEGMVLCASNDDHTKVEFIEPPQDAKIGERVVCNKYPGDFDKVLKKETLDAVSLLNKTNDNKIATYNGDEWMTSAGPCFAATITNGLIK